MGSLEVMSAISLPPEGRRVLLSDPGRGRDRTSSSSPTILRKESSLRGVCVCVVWGGPLFGRTILCEDGRGEAHHRPSPGTSDDLPFNSPGQSLASALPLDLLPSPCLPAPRSWVFFPAAPAEQGAVPLPLKAFQACESSGMSALAAVSLWWLWTLFSFRKLRAKVPLPGRAGKPRGGPVRHCSPSAVRRGLRRLHPDATCPSQIEFPFSHFLGGKT